MQELHSKTEALLNVIYSIEEEMILQSEGQPGEPAVNTGKIQDSNSGPEIQYMKLSYPFHDVPARDHLYSGTNSRLKLDNALKEYADYISGLSSESEHENFLSLLDPGIYFPDGNGRERGCLIDSCSPLSCTVKKQCTVT